MQGGHDGVVVVVVQHCVCASVEVDATMGVGERRGSEVRRDSSSLSEKRGCFCGGHGKAGRAGQVLSLVRFSVSAGVLGV
jgi:hypothetical protein